MNTVKILLSAALLVVSGLSYANESANESQALPKALLEGYWISPVNIEGEYMMVDFRQEKDGSYSTTNYRHKCSADGKFKQISNEKSVIQIADEGMDLVFEGQEPIFGLEVLELEPRKWLVLRQYFKGEEMKRYFPDGINFAYLYETKPIPYCALYGMG